MEKKMTFNYFYGTEADQFSFYRIPKALFTDSYFKDLSSDAKILYGLMLDRMSLSIKNQWFDDKNRAYIYFSIEDIMELLNCGRNKAIKSMRELDDETGIGLIEKRRQGFGKVNVIYVKTFMPEKTDEKKFGEELEKFKKQTSVENEETAEVYNLNFMKSQNQTSRSPENKLQEVYISNPNNTNLSDTEMNDNKSNPIISVDEKRFDSDNHSENYQAYENLVKETIDYESLEITHHDDMRQVDEIVNLIVETVMCKNDKILIASNWYPASLVKKKFLMLTYSHIEYVLHCMSGNTTKVKNIKKYLLAALFNAPSTMNGYYQAEVNNMKTPASGEKTFYTAETPKVYQIFTTDNMLWTGGNGTGLSYCLKYADDSTDENPVVLHLITKIQLLKIRSNKLLHHGKSIKLGALDNITREKFSKTSGNSLKYISYQ